MLFWGQWWNFTFKTSIKVCSNLEKKQQILQKRLVKVFFWKRKMQFSQQLWKHFDKSSNKQLKIWIKTFEKEGLNQNVFPSNVPLKVLKAVREQWYIFLVESPKFSLKYQKVYEIWFSFKKSSDFTYSHAERCFDNNGENGLGKSEKFQRNNSNFLRFFKYFGEKICTKFPLDK